MMITLGAHIIIAFDIGAIEYRLTFDTLLPQTFRNAAGAFAPTVAAYTGRENFVYPTHALPRHPKEEGIIDEVGLN
tara:strand:- start:2874 stop:3101 length:228 start_codon:yes stop_codon:yes gene_type:complete